MSDNFPDEGIRGKIEEAVDKQDSLSQIWLDADKKEQQEIEEILKRSPKALQRLKEEIREYHKEISGAENRDEIDAALSKMKQANRLLDRVDLERIERNRRLGAEDARRASAPRRMRSERTVSEPMRSAGTAPGQMRSERNEAAAAQNGAGEAAAAHAGGKKTKIIVLIIVLALICAGVYLVTSGFGRKKSDTSSTSSTSKVHSKVVHAAEHQTVNVADYVSLTPSAYVRSNDEDCIQLSTNSLDTGKIGTYLASNGQLPKNFTQAQWNKVLSSYTFRISPYEDVEMGETVTITAIPPEKGEEGYDLIKSCAKKSRENTTLEAGSRSFKLNGYDNRYPFGDWLMADNYQLVQTLVNKCYDNFNENVNDGFGFDTMYAYLAVPKENQTNYHTYIVFVIKDKSTDDRDDPEPYWMYVAGPIDKSSTAADFDDLDMDQSNESGQGIWHDKFGTHDATDSLQNIIHRMDSPGAITKNNGFSYDENVGYYLLQFNVNSILDAED